MGTTKVKFNNFNIFVEHIPLCYIILKIDILLQSSINFEKYC